MPKSQTKNKATKKTVSKKASYKKRLNIPRLSPRTFVLGLAVLLVFSMLGAFVGQAWQDSQFSAKAVSYNYATVVQNDQGILIKVCKSGSRINISINSKKSVASSSSLTSEFINSATGGQRLSTINSSIGRGAYIKYRTVQGSYFSISADGVGSNYAKNPDARPRIAVSKINACEVK